MEAVFGKKGEEKGVGNAEDERPVWDWDRLQQEGAYLECSLGFFFRGMISGQRGRGGVEHQKED